MKSIQKLVVAAVLVLSTAPLAIADDAAKQAIAVRKAAFTLIANNFKPIGEVIQGKVTYNQAEIKKRAERVAFLSELLEGTFPESSNLGEPATKSKADIWKKKAEFDKQMKDFETNARALAKIAATETTASEAFMSAAKAVGNGCKSCHDDFKHK
jgi:cytochrome c556